MFSDVLRPLLVLYRGSCNGPRRNAEGELNAASLSFNFIFAVLYLGLSILCIAALAIARAYRRAFALILVSLVCSLIQSAALIARDMGADCDLSPDLFENVVVGGAMAAHFHYWASSFFFLAFCLLLRFRAEKATQHSNGQKDAGNEKSTLSSAWHNGYLIIFSFLMLFGTTTSALYTYYIRLKASDYSSVDAFETEMDSRADRFGGNVYAFDAFWFASAFFLGGLAFTVNKIVRESGLEVKVLKIMFHFVFPLYALRALVDFIFTIIHSPSGLDHNLDNLTAVYGAYLAEQLLTNIPYAAAIMILLICGCKRSLWIEGMGQGAQATYPLQPTYPAQVVYTSQPVYQLQPGYVAQPTYLVQPNQIGQPIYTTQPQQSATTSPPPLQERQNSGLLTPPFPEEQTSPPARADQSRQNL